MNRSDENKVLHEEVKRTLDNQVDLLDLPIRSRLTQARFHAIDRGLLSSNNWFNHNKNIISYFTGDRLSSGRRVVLSGVTFVGAIALTFLISSNIESQLISANKMVSLVPVQSEDTKEEIEIYHWLFEHYGVES